MSDKIKYELEFLVKTSTKVLYNMLSSASGLSEWFCDDVNFRGEVYTFIWDGDEEKAKLITKKSNEYIKFQWEDDAEEGNKNYFELRIKVDPMTKDVALIVTDFAEEDELEEAQMLWKNQVGELKQVLGA